MRTRTISRANALVARTAQLVVATAALVVAPIAHADLVDIVNDIRSAGCDRRTPARVRVASAPSLDAAARLVARGAELGKALEQSSYRATRSTSIDIGGVANDAAIREVLADGFCEAVNNASYTAIGTYARGDRFWIVLAAPFTPLEATDAGPAAERVLALVNEARAEDRRCGRRRFGATHPLRLSDTLTRAAAAHATDMARGGYMGHRGSDGSNVGERANRAGYQWRAVGENVAAGQQDADTVVRSWLESPGHCENIMGPQFTEMGIAYESAPRSELRILWAQVFAAPR